MTNRPPMRDRSVVTSSVRASTKYCCSGSLLRLVKGSTTIDRRGAARGCEMEVVAAAVEVSAAGHRLQTPIAMIITAAAAAIAAETARRQCGAATGELDAGNSATAPGRNA